MTMILQAYYRAFGQLVSKSMREIIWIATIIPTVILVGLLFVCVFVLFKSGLFADENDIGFIGILIVWAIDFFGVGIALFLACMIFPNLFSLVILLFFEKAARLVEKRYYPYLKEPQHQSILEQGFHGLKFLILISVVNSVAIIFYLIFLFLGPINVLIFYLVNGYLLGKELFEQVALRRIDKSSAKCFWRESRIQLILAGCINAVMMTIPIVNLLAPLISIMVMVHLFESRRDVL